LTVISERKSTKKKKKKKKKKNTKKFTKKKHTKKSKKQNQNKIISMKNVYTIIRDVLNRNCGRWERAHNLPALDLFKTAEYCQLIG